jgi:glycosyltransferase involved in cell wall biosynthesis
VRIILTADPYLPVPPVGYGGIERVVASVADELVSRGHDVTLVAHPASRTRAALVPYGAPPHRGPVARARELAQVGCVLWSRRRRTDVIHSFGRLAALAPVLPTPVAKVQSYQRAVPWSGVRRARRLAAGPLLFTGCSTALYQDAPGEERRRWRTVHNPVDQGRYTPQPHVPDDAPLMFLGRLEAIKGVREAIEIARLAGRRLIVAGHTVDSPEGRRCVEADLRPAIDGHAVEYVGEIDDDRKNALLGASAALLMPVRWDEPFGIVMIEALACGTPVVGFARGSVPEVVRHGETGFVCAGVADAALAVGRLAAIDRRLCRDDAERRFGVGAVVDRYEQVYAEALAC